MICTASHYPSHYTSITSSQCLRVLSREKLNSSTRKGKCSKPRLSASAATVNARRQLFTTGAEGLCTTPEKQAIVLHANKPNMICFHNTQSGNSARRVARDRTFLPRRFRKLTIFAEVFSTVSQSLDDCRRVVQRSTVRRALSQARRSACRAS